MLKPAAVLAEASDTAVDLVLEGAAALHEAVPTLVAGLVLLSSVLDAVTDVVEVVLAMASIDVEVVAVLMEMVAVHLEAVFFDLVSAVMKLEVAAFSLEMGAVDLVAAGVELEDLVVHLESEDAAVSDLPTTLEVVAILIGPTVVFEIISALPSLLLERVFGDGPSDFEALIWTSFESDGPLVVLEGVSVITDMDVVTEVNIDSPESISMFITW